ncbi:MAG TPA: hypothetical protein VLG50_00765 [Candidatus Saccharimonadales bacterium]|nr:hypothetical protein [Candidatus Saccharimonadales bacterium]
MKNKILCSIFLYSSLLQAPLLTNHLLKSLDNAGMFNDSIYEFILVRMKLKEFINGKFLWKGVQSNLSVVDNNNTALAHKLHVILKRPETIFGATFVILSPDHPRLLDFVADSEKSTVKQFIQNIKKNSLLHRYENIDYSTVATGSYALHPITGQKMPVFISDYSLEGFDTRTTNAHLAIPAHNEKDFIFAHKHKLDIRQVVTAPKEGRSSGPHYHKNSKELTTAYTGDYYDSIIINSDFANGPAKTATEKIIAYLQEHHFGLEYQENMLYSLHGKSYSIKELQEIEATLQKENKELSPGQKEAFAVIMLQAHCDFLGLVEHFLVYAKEYKELLIGLIDESSKMRKNHDCYLLRWANTDNSESEKVMFKRDITTFHALKKFCLDLCDFLGDFASSCPNALENLKGIKK